MNFAKISQTCIKGSLNNKMVSFIKNKNILYKGDLYNFKVNRQRLKFVMRGPELKIPTLAK